LQYGNETLTEQGMKGKDALLLLKQEFPLTCVWR